MRQTIYPKNGQAQPGAVASPDLAAPYNAHRAAVLAAIADGAATFDEVRAACGKSAEVLPDGHIHQVAIDAGYVVAP